MLFRRIDLNSIPFGLAVAGEDLVKGMLVTLALVNGQYVATKAKTADVADGFVTYRIEEQGGADKDFDVLKKGKRVVVYSLENMNMWGTTEFNGTPKVGDTMSVVDGKVDPTAPTATAKMKLEVARVYDAGVGYTAKTIDVRVIR